MELCRLCLSESKNNIDIINNQELVNKIKECVSIQIILKENYPKSVCIICVENLNSWYEFREMCLRTNTILISGNAKGGGKTSQNSEISEIRNDNVSFKLNKASQNKIIPTDFPVSDIIDSNSPNRQNHDDDFKNETSLHDKSLEIEETDFFDDTCVSDNDQHIDNCPGNGENKQHTLIYNCDICDEMFTFYTDYLDHQFIHEGDAVFHCEKCPMTFTSKANLAEHERSHKIPCYICGTAVQKQSMRAHLNKHTDRFKCPDCLQCFTCGPLLKEHITARHTKLKPYSCDFCGKEFATKGSLVLHLKTHGDAREYQCDKCEYAGRTSMALRIHMSKHENNVCICEYCSKIFKSNRNLNDHLKRVHCSYKKHCCSYCGMRFLLRYQLETHIRTHTGIHPYNCKKCSKTFARLDSLKAHMTTHDRNVFFDCKSCSKRFLSKRGLQRHNCIPLMCN